MINRWIYLSDEGVMCVFMCDGILVESIGGRSSSEWCIDMRVLLTLSWKEPRMVVISCKIHIFSMRVWVYMFPYLFIKMGQALSIRPDLLPPPVLLGLLLHLIYHLNLFLFLFLFRVLTPSFKSCEHWRTIVLRTILRTHVISFSMKCLSMNSNE